MISFFTKKESFALWEKIETKNMFDSDIYLPVAQASSLPREERHRAPPRPRAVSLVRKRRDGRGKKEAMLFGFGFNVDGKAMIDRSGKKKNALTTSSLSHLNNNNKN